MSGSRWIVSIGAIVVAVAALWVLLRLDRDGAPEHAPELSQPALDEIDDASRKAMRELLERDGREE